MSIVQGCGRLAEFFEDWNYLVRRDGWRFALPVIGREMMALPYRHLNFVVVARSLLNPLPILQPKMSLEIREFEPTDLNLVRQIDRPSEVRLCTRRLACGQRGLLALYKGQPAGYAWACTEVQPGLERVQITLSPGDMLCVDVYTSPAFRGKGVHTALTLARFALFRELGYSRAVTYIEKRNYPSLAVWRKVGSQVLGHIEFNRIGPWRYQTMVDITPPSGVVVHELT
jgi:GNAT superfamily N-acetyltransferase